MYTTVCMNQDNENDLKGIYRLFRSSSCKLGEYQVYYKRDFLRDQLRRCKYKIGIMHGKKCVGFLSGRVMDTNIGMYIELNYLVVHWKHRGNGLTDILKKGIKNLVTEKTCGALYTTPSVFGVLLEKLDYYHLNTFKLKNNITTFTFNTNIEHSRTCELVDSYDKKYRNYSFYEILKQDFFKPKSDFNCVSVSIDGKFIGFISYYNTFIKVSCTKATLKCALLYYYTVPDNLLVSSDWINYLYDLGITRFDTTRNIGGEFERGTGTIYLCTTTRENEIGITSIGYNCI